MAAYCARRRRPILLCIVANIGTDLSLTGDDNRSSSCQWPPFEQLNSACCLPGIHRRFISTRDKRNGVAFLRRRVLLL